MADIGDVYDSVSALIAGVIYPNGTSQPPVNGIQTRIYGGWPVKAQLDADLLAGNAHITVYGRESRNTTRYQTVPLDIAVTPPTLTLTINANTVTVDGTVAAGVNTAILAGTKAYLYQTVANDTPSTIAAALATLINADFPGTSATGPVITLPATATIAAARVGGSGSQVTEVGRVEQVFQITIWTNTPANRKSIASLIVPQLMNSRFLTLADGSAARMILQGQRDDDMPQKELLYRRDIMAKIEYAETITNTSTTVVDIVENIAVGVNGYNGGTYPNTTTINI
ncbi:hypothetical protein BZM27_06030 [Paraburkholderia steynii]|uniref:Uncharacterized protein n=1 Tax=Paraburkholderia steynii TaxID=1245441 RepID=A0A4R0XP79_9BURK|nr:hypothetical protein BZM27_06030 [Paraburkholderia steynii]